MFNKLKLIFQPQGIDAIEDHIDSEVQRLLSFCHAFGNLNTPGFRFNTVTPKIHLRLYGSMHNYHGALAEAQRKVSIIFLHCVCCISWLRPRLGAAASPAAQLDCGCISIRIGASISAAEPLCSVRQRRRGRSWRCQRCRYSRQRQRKPLRQRRSRWHRRQQQRQR